LLFFDHHHHPPTRAMTIAPMIRYFIVPNPCPYPRPRPEYPDSDP
jgi:hypothetical protein